jgi:hypothetical protein
MPLSTNEINPNKTPEEFFLEDPLNLGTFDQVNLEQTDLTDFPGAIKVKKKKVFNGVAWLAMRENNIGIYWQRDEDATPFLVAEAELVAKVWYSAAWRDRAFSFIGAEIDSSGDNYIAQRIEDVPAIGVTDAMWGLKCNWKYGDVKFEFYADAPGMLTRINWNLRVKDSAIADPGEKGLTISVVDYSGNVNHNTGADPEPGWTWHKYAFEPDGYQCPDADQQRYNQDAGLKIDPYLSVDDAGATITVTTGAETVTFTVATADANLLQATPIMITVIETYYIWYIYDLRMIRYRHDTGDTTTGMALTTGHGGPYNIISEHDWYAMTAAEATANAARTTQLQDVTMAAPSTGTEVADLVWPLQLADGFGADRARHFTDASEVIAYTDDATRVGHVDVWHDPMITTDGETDLVVGHWKLDDVDADTVLDDEKGSNAGALVGGNTLDNLTNVDTIRGKSLLLDGTDDILDFDDGFLALADDDKFTISMWVKPAFLYTVGTAQRILDIRSASTNRLFFYYSTGGLYWLYNDIANANDETSIGPDHDSDSGASLNEWRQLVISVDLSNDLIHVVFGEWILHLSDITQNWSAAPTLCRIGVSSVEPNIYISDVKIINGCLLSYGAYYTGNGSVDATAHEDITFLWQGADATPIGSDVTNDGGDYATDGPIGTKAFDNDTAGQNASAATSGNISAAEGSLSFWFKPNSALGADCTLFYADAAFKIWWDDSDNDVVFTYNTDVLNMGTAFAAGDTSWHHIHVMWKASDSLYINVDGLVTSLLTGVDAAPTLDATMYFTADDADGTNRANVLMSDFFITDTMGTPQIPVILGSGPIYAPRRTIT